MTGYRFMARLRRYYAVHWPFAGDKDGGHCGREESEMQAASRRIWFSASRKRSSLGKGRGRGGGIKGRELCDTSRRKRRRGAGEEGHEEGRGGGGGKRLRFGPRTRDYCRDNEAKARFLPFQPRARRNDISND